MGPGDALRHIDKISSIYGQFRTTILSVYVDSGLSSTYWTIEKITINVPLQQQKNLFIMSLLQATL